MLRNVQLLVYERCSAIVLLFFLSIACQAMAGGELSDHSVPLTLVLEPSTNEHNRFGVETGLNTLVPGRGMERSHGIVGWSGSFDIDLYVGDAMVDGLPTILGIQLNETAPTIEQSPAAISYCNLPVGVQFATSDIFSEMIQKSESMIDVEPGATPGQYYIAPNSFAFMQMMGEAGVNIENRPSEMQDISDRPIEIRMTDGMTSPQTSLLIELLHGFDVPMYRATLSMPMAGHAIQYTDTGLPVDWRYTSGELAASGTFSVSDPAIPEPSSMVLTMLSLVAIGWRVRRAG